MAVQQQSSIDRLESDPSAWALEMFGAISLRVSVIGRQAQRLSPTQSVLSVRLPE